MKIVNVIGGIGNQMFQYAFAYAMQLRQPAEKVYLDTTLFNGYGLHNGFEIERVFGLQLPIASWKEIIKVNWYLPHYKLARAARKLLPKRKTIYLNPEYLTFDPNALMKEGDIYYDGYWQTAKYFDVYREQILDLFAFPGFTDDTNREFARLLLSENTVTIHVRRGDYLNASNFKGICEIEYYKRAIEKANKLIKDPTFFIFSNDIEWCKSNLLKLIEKDRIYFVDCNNGSNSYNDMHLMTLARCNILANSSFSWWAAYLNQRKDKIILCPDKWVNNVKDTDVYMDNWIKIN